MSSSNVSSVVNYFAQANEGFATTLGSTISGGAVTVPFAGTAGLTNGSIFVGIIEPGQTNQQVFTGIVNVSSSEITSVVWTRGTNNSHVAGVTIVDYVTGTHFNMMSAGILKQHTQTGAHIGISNTGGLTTDTLDVTTGELLNPVATLDGNPVWQYLGYEQITSNIGSLTAGSATQLTGLTVTVTVPTGVTKVKVTLQLPGLTSGVSTSIIYPSIWAGTVGSGTQLTQADVTTAGTNYLIPVTLVAVYTPSAGSITFNAGYNGGDGGTLEAAATYPAFILVECC
jgi:hypothetical protein